MPIRGAILAISAPEDLSLSVTIRGELAIERGHRAIKLYSAGPGEPKHDAVTRLYLGQTACYFYVKVSKGDRAGGRAHRS